MTALKIVWALAIKDLQLESRNRDVGVAIVMFAGLVISIFVIAIEPTPETSTKVGSGVLWAAIAFAGVVGLARSMAHEMDGDSISSLMLAPISRDLIFLGKSLGNLIFLLVAEAVIFAIFTLLFNLWVIRLEIIATGLLIAIGFSSVGTFFASLTLRVRAREVLLPMLFLPVVFPLLFSAIEITSTVIQGGSWQASLAWLQLAIAYDVIFLAVSSYLFSYVLED